MATELAAPGVRGCRPLEAVVLDVDGTLVDSERHGHRVAFNAAFADAGLAYRWDEERYGELLAVPGGRERIRHFLLAEGHDEHEAEALAARLHARKNAHVQALVAAGRIPARPGVPRLLDELTRAGVPLGVATTGSREWVEPLLDGLFGLGRFAVVLTRDEVPRLKPEPDIYEEAVTRLGVAPEGVVAVEDAEKGVAAAVGAGLCCLAVVNDYTAGERFDAATLVVDRFGAPGESAVIGGPADALEGSAVTVATLRRLLAAGAAA